MNAFIEYVLLELKNSFRIAFFIAIAALAILIVIYALYTQKNKGARKFAWAKALLWIAFVSYMAIVAYATLLRGNDTYEYSLLISQIDDEYYVELVDVVVRDVIMK